MPSRGFVLWFQDPSSETRTTSASQIAHELKERGCNVEILDGQSATDNISVLEDLKGDEAVAVVALESNAPQKLEDLCRSVAVKVEVESEQSVADILSKLEALELISRSASRDSSYDEDDEATIRQRLEALGYL
jgi:hypothetical protein